MDNKSIIDVLIETQALQNGHFLLSSGKHSKEYIQCQKILQYPKHGIYLANLLVNKLRPLNVDVVIGPALGAIHWEVFLALALEHVNSDIIGIFAEKVLIGDETVFKLRRGQKIEPGQNVLVVEDVVTTGNSAKKIIELVLNLKANPVAVASLINRTPDLIKFNIPLISLLDIKLETYDPHECPLCSQNIPIDKPGSSVIKA